MLARFAKQRGGFGPTFQELRIVSIVININTSARRRYV
jgi:hypothetical protein